MPCSLYTDKRKDWEPFLGFTVARMEKSSGNTSAEKGEGWDGGMERKIERGGGDRERSYNTPVYVIC